MPLPRSEDPNRLYRQSFDRQHKKPKEKNLIKARARGARYRARVRLDPIRRRIARLKKFIWEKQRVIDRGKAKIALWEQQVTEAYREREVLKRSAPTKGLPGRPRIAKAPQGPDRPSKAHRPKAPTDSHPWRQ